MAVPTDPNGVQCLKDGGTIPLVGTTSYKSTTIRAFWCVFCQEGQLLIRQTSRPHRQWELEFGKGQTDPTWVIGVGLSWNRETWSRQVVEPGDCTVPEDVLRQFLDQLQQAGELA